MVEMGHGAQRRAIGAWEAGVEFNRKIPERAERFKEFSKSASRSLLSGMRTFGSESVVVVGDLSGYIFVKAPVKITKKTLGLFSAGFEKMSGMANAIAETRRLRIKEKTEWEEVIRKEHDRFEKFLLQQDLTLEQVTRMLRLVADNFSSESNRIFTNNGKKVVDEYGVSHKSRKEKVQDYLRLLEKGISIYELQPKSETTSLLHFYETIELTYTSLTYIEQSSDRLREIAQKILKAVQEASTDKIRKVFKNYTSREYGNFTKDHFQADRITKATTSSGSRLSGTKAFEFLSRIHAEQDDFRFDTKSYIRYHDRLTGIVMEHFPDMLKYVVGPKVYPRELIHLLSVVSDAQYRLPSPDSIGKIARVKLARKYRSIFDKAISQLSTIELLKIKSAIYQADEKKKHIASYFEKRFRNASRDFANQLAESSESFHEMLARTLKYAEDYSLDRTVVSMALHEAVMSHIELLKSVKEIRDFYGHDLYWPESRLDEATTPIERPLSYILAEKRKAYPESPAWRYDPIFSENVHRKIVAALVTLDALPDKNDFEGRYQLWDMLSSRGVSTVTDKMLGELVDMATPEQLDRIESHAVDKGRVMDQKIQDQFALRQIKKSSAYRILLTVSDSPPQLKIDRISMISEVATVAQMKLGELGMAYVSFMEELSIRIQASRAESDHIEDLKRRSLIRGIEDAATSGDRDQRFHAFKQILRYMAEWNPKRQMEFILFLRGSIEATPFIESQFPLHGPERVRSMFQGLPVEGAMRIMQIILGETLLSGKRTVSKGYAKKLMKRIVTDGVKEKGNDTESLSEHKARLAEEQLNRKYATQLLDALIVGLQKSGNSEFQLSVLSALAAMKPDESKSVGETIKVILERFPGVGPKIAQFLVPTNVFDDTINEVLRRAQDNTLPPKLNEMYIDAEEIFGQNKKVPFTIVRPLGSGSMKYTYLARMNDSGELFVMQVFRSDIQFNSELYIEVLENTVEELIRKNGNKWAFLGVIVDGAVNAVRQEKRTKREYLKTMIARKKLYNNFGDGMFDVAVPEQTLLKDRFLYSRFAKGVSFFELGLLDRQAVGTKILEMEAELLFREGGRSAVWFDADRHAGNYLIYVRHLMETQRGEKPFLISPIDFGQLTFITQSQRSKLVELFAMASLATKMGSNPWISNKVGEILGVHSADRDRLNSIMKEFFPMPLSSSSEGSIIGAYFSLIASVQRAIANSKMEYKGDLKGKRVNFAYINFVRSIIQLNQYEREIYVPEGTTTPSRLLESRVKDVLANELPNLKVTALQQTAVRAKNSWRWLVSKAKREPYNPIKIVLTREELEEFKLFDAKKDEKILRQLQELGWIRSVIPEFQKTEKTHRTSEPGKANQEGPSSGSRCVKSVSRLSPNGHF